MDKVIEAPHDFFYWSNAVVGMREIEVDTIGPQSFETRVDGLQHCLAMIPGAGRRRRSFSCACVFCEQHNVFATSEQELPEHFLRLSPR
jgi:hypothetical protein